MVDLVKELKELKNNSLKNILENFSQERKDLEKKIHVFNVLLLISELEEMVDNNLFEKENVNYITLEKDYDRDVGNVLEFNLYNEKEEYFCSDVLSDLLNESIEKLEGFRNDLVAKDFNGFLRIFPTKDGIEKIKDSLLSKELLMSINYAEMQNNLLENDNVQPKKKKI